MGILVATCKDCFYSFKQFSAALAVNEYIVHEFEYTWDVGESPVRPGAEFIARRNKSHRCSFILVSSPLRHKTCVGS